MSNVKDIDDFRPDDYWFNRMMSIQIDELSILYKDMDNDDIEDSRIAFVRFFNLFQRLHKKGISYEDIFAGGFAALLNKVGDLDRSNKAKLYKEAHDRLTKFREYLCCERLGIDPIEED